jgi:hypothetical protein
VVRDGGAGKGKKEKKRKETSSGRRLRERHDDTRTFTYIHTYIHTRSAVQHKAPHHNNNGAATTRARERSSAHAHPLIGHCRGMFWFVCGGLHHTRKNEKRRKKKQTIKNQILIGHLTSADTIPSAGTSNDVVLSCLTCFCRFGATAAAAAAGAALFATSRIGGGGGAEAAAGAAGCGTKSLSRSTLRPLCPVPPPFSLPLQKGGPGLRLNNYRWASKNGHPQITHSPTHPPTLISAPVV